MVTALQKTALSWQGTRLKSRDIPGQFVGGLFHACCWKRSTIFLGDIEMVRKQKTTEMGSALEHYTCDGAMERRIRRNKTYVKD